MRTRSAAATRVLAADQIATLRDAQGTRIECASGSLWITQLGDSRDIFLAPGEAFTLDRKGGALIQASGQSIALITAPRAPAAWWRRRASTLLGYVMRLGMRRGGWQTD